MYEINLMNRSEGVFDDLEEYVYLPTENKPIHDQG